MKKSTCPQTTESDTIRPEIAEHGDNSPGGSLKSCFNGCGSSHLIETNNYYVCRYCGMTYSKKSPNIKQYMTDQPACEKDVNNSTEPFPSILQSAEDARRLARKP
jgi:hypothetical protein